MTMDESGILKLVDSAVDEVVGSIVEREFLSGNLKAFCSMSSNLLRLMPQIPIKEHRTIYQKLLKLKILENTPQFLTAVDWNQSFIETEGSIELLKQSSVIISFHLGAFRSFEMLLVRHNINIVFVVDTSVYDIDPIRKVLLSNLELSKTLFKGSSSQMEVLAADSSDTVIRLLSFIQKGYSVGLYVDWNSGMKNEEQNVSIPFLNETISVRQGPAYLSYFTGIPILPITCSINDNYEIRWKIHQAIFPDKMKPINQYAVESLSYVFGILGDLLLSYFDQWQGWLHIHKYLINIDTTEFFPLFEYSTGMALEVSPYVGLFVLSDNNFIMNRLTGKIVRVNRKIYENLSTTENEVVSLDCSDDEKRQLYELGILVPAVML
jgi:lauroyl/myristoyl acyltransferase